MKKVALGLLALAMAAFARPTLADSVSGNVDIGGADAYSMTGITFFNPGLVFNATGSLAIMSANFLDLNNITFASAPGELLFDFNNGGTEITMTIASLTVLQNTSTFLNTKGSATLTETGFSPAVYDFTLMSNVGLSITTYSLDLSPAAIPAPEPASLLLLGSGLLSVAGIRRRRSGC